MEVNMTALRMGNALRAYLAGRGVKKAEKYSYNGVVLPDIYKVYTPELQKELPLAILFDSSGNGTNYGSISLWFFKTYKFITTGSVTILASDGCKFCSFVDDMWGDVTDYTYKHATLALEYLAWSNFDIINEDGSVYLAASAPIPVYE